MSVTNITSEGAPRESKQHDDLGEILLLGETKIVGGEWFFDKLLALFSIFLDPVAAWVLRKEFVAQLSVEEMAMLMLSVKDKSPEVVNLEIEELIRLWLQMEHSDGLKLKTTDLRKLVRHLERHVWRGNETDSNSEESLPPVHVFMASSYFAVNYRMMEIVTSGLLCKSYLRGVCMQGATCVFNHDVERARSNICKKFQNGMCKTAQNCESLHVLTHELPVTQMLWKPSLNNRDGDINSPSRAMAERYIQKSSGPFEPRSHPTRDFSRPEQSYASYHSAQSSLRSGSLATNFSLGFYGGPSRRTPGASFQQSPAYYSARSSLATNTDKAILDSVNKPLSGYLKAVHEKGLVLPLDQELNWSGKENGGQHVEYVKGEELPFEVIGPIGASLTAQVDKIRCRRILLARKTMVCGRRMTVEEALVEVEHLQNLRHPHIIQLVGSYLQGKKFSVLLYPVADCDLSVFLDEVYELVQETSDLEIRAATAQKEPAPPAIASMWSFFGCLADAVRYIHSTARKHLDIKPGNILVKKHPRATYGYRVYVADFGISRSFKALDHSQTDTHIRRTPKYCAPEVWEQDVHGRTADIFSLGCVFMEMLTVLCGCKCDIEEFAEFRSKDSESNGAYHETIDRVFEWSQHLRPELEGYYMYANFFRTFESSVSLVPKIEGLDATLQMLAREPGERRLPIFNRGEPGVDGCHTCGDVPEVFEYGEEA